MKLVKMHLLFHLETPWPFHFERDCLISFSKFVRDRHSPEARKCFRKKERKYGWQDDWMFRTLQPIIIQGQRKISSSLWMNCFDSELHNFLGNNLILFLTLCMVCSIEIFNFKPWIWQKAQNEPTGFWIGYLRPGLWSG